MELSPFLEILTAVIVPLGTVSFVFFSITLFQKKLFLSLREAFNEAELPPNGIKLLYLRYGVATYRNSSRMGEEGNDFILKVPMQNGFRIPYASCSKFTNKVDSWNRNFIKVEFKDTKVQNLEFALDAKQLEQFPKLKARLDRTSSVQVVSTKQVIDPNKISEVKSKIVSVFIKSIVAFIFILIFFYLRNRYGFFGF